jgi:hypothetical protein
MAEPSARRKNRPWEIQTVSGGAAVVAANAAAAAKRLADQEEEEMTPYSPKDLADDWQFKILRSATGKFRNAVWMHAVLQEEARAGWTLVEKFDNARLRLKRPASARRGDGALDFDPLRTWVGIGQGRFVALILLATLVGSGLLVLLVAVIVRLAGG